MKTMNVSWTRAAIFGVALLFLAGCGKDDEPVATGEAEFQITDAPSDDASIQNVIVTVADIKVDGQSVSGFTRTTFDLKAYRDGSVKVLGQAKMVAKNYSTITLVLDADTEANGSTPGCYVFTATGEKFKLRTSGMINLVVSKGWSVAANGKTIILLDFDLRKAIRADADPNVRYSFVSNGNLQGAVRVVTKGNSGTINGAYSEQFTTNADLVVAYAYKKGTYSAAVETTTQGADGIRFWNAVTSAVVKSDITQSFKLAFLEQGDYEIHFASYNHDAGTGKYNFQSMLVAETAVGGFIGDFVTVNSNADVAVTTTITGIF